jgi:hypothetical protein
VTGFNNPGTGQIGQLNGVGNLITPVSIYQDESPN